MAKKKRRKKNPTLPIILTLLIGIGLVALTWTVLSSEKTRLGQERQLFRVGRDPLWHPVSLAGREKEMVAFTNQLFREIENEEAIDVQFVTISSSESLNGIDRGLYDAAITSIQPTGRLERNYIFSEPYFLYGPILLVPTNSPIKSLDDTAGKVIGIPVGSSLEFDARKSALAIWNRYDTPIEALELLSEGRLDGVIMNSILATTYNINLFSNQFKVLTGPLTKNGFRLVTRNTLQGEKLITAFNRGLQKIRDDGTYNALLERWGFSVPLSQALLLLQEDSAVQ